MKNAIVAAGLLSGALLLSGAVCAGEALPKTQEGLIKELIASIDQLEALLAGVKDEAGVAAAKPQMHKIMAHQDQIGKAMKTVPQPTPEEDAKLKQLYAKKTQEAMARLAKQYQRLASVKGFKEAVADIKAKVRQ